MSELRTLTYVVKMDVGDGKEKTKQFRVTLKTMEQDAKKASVEVDKLAKTIGDKYGAKVTTAIDNTRTVKNEIVAATREATRSEKAFNRLANEYTNLTAKTGKSADVQEKMNALQRLGSNATLTQKKDIIRLVKAQQAQVIASSNTQKSFRGLRGQAQNLGWQLQDVAVQAQMGTSALVILGQQGSQLASGFGATGALVGAGIAVASAIGGVIYSSYKAKKGIGDLTKITEDLNTVFRESSSGADVLSSKILDLAKRSESLAKIEISKGILNSGKQIKTAINDVTKVIGDSSFTFRESYAETFDGLRKSTSKSYDEILKSTGNFMGMLDKGLKGTSLNELGALERNTRALRKEFGLSRDQAIRLGVSVSNFSTKKTVLSAKTLQNTLEDLNDETAGSSEKLIKFAGDLIPLFTSITDGTDRTNLLRMAFLDLKGALKSADSDTDKMASSLNSLVKGLEEEADALYKNKRQLDLEKAARNGGNSETFKSIMLSHDAIDAYNDEQKAIDDKADAEKKASAALNKQLSEQQKLRKDHMSALEKYSDEGRLIKLEIQYQKEKELLAGNKVALLNLERDYADEKIKINGSVWEQMSVSARESLENTDDMMAESLDRFVSGTADAFGNAIVNADSFGDAMQSVFKGAISSMISFFAEWAIQKTLMWAFSEAGDSAAQLSSATTLTMNAQAASVMAGLNAFQSTAAIPYVGAMLAPAAAGAAVAATQPMAAAASSFAFAGVFDKGGAIPAGQKGIVAEYGDELVGGTMVYNGSQKSLGVTGREDTAKMMGGNTNIPITVNSSGNASPDAIARSIARALKKSNKVTDNAIFDSMNRGRNNRGKKFA
jgi:hypothetical protein